MVSTRRGTLLSLLLASGVLSRLRAQSKPSAEIQQVQSLFDFEELAHKRVSPAAWARVQGGSADELS